MTVESPSIAVDPDLNTWLEEQVQAEVQRLQQQHVRALALPVKNMCIRIDTTRPAKPSAINCIEVRTHFDFNTIQQMMVSDPKPCPLREDQSYVHVLLFTEKPIPLILPYIYPNTLKTREDMYDGVMGGLDVRNRLNDWQFVNGKGEISRHQVKSFHRK